MCVKSLHGMSLWWYLSETSSSQLSYGICHLLRELGTELYKSKEKDKKKSASSGERLSLKEFSLLYIMYGTGI